MLASSSKTFRKEEGEIKLLEIDGQVRRTQYDDPEKNTRESVNLKKNKISTDEETAKLRIQVINI